ncbi:hypothetical protein Pcinc_015196 [Petrolisthes cinctipes]|uniref:WAP domain-containing protein n=1 Tax=Petrolisthes cinctipes TaxID=88211 RepID=A0AAE1KNE8_PETCI|nr:hypothetical protein Pcinc_015188 [Petrolisthes cinctipes]KAK3880311.1 hypothetical protein Pcinc_015190 [Petrolisthes cinctipes]KAK3880317.1 hypothetical protein Pcinc_015196 [Petrolisthes cinctipes]
MMMVRVGVVVLVVMATVVTMTEAGSVGAGHPGPPCRHTCFRENPGQPDDGETYCCDRGNLPDIPSETHPGRCPHAIPCPASGTRFQPKACAQDGHCRYHEKCCYNSCVKYHVCKLAS